MGREIYVSSLTVGRCFTFTPDPTDDETEGPSDPMDVQIRRTVLSPSHVWKITAASGDGVDATSASGQTRSFDAKTLVVEIPRQGFDKLAARS